MVAKPVIFIVGETASGKSDLAIKVAKQINGAIINADSWSVYKGFDIGTAKPTKQELEQVDHYLIDVADPEDGFSAAVFKRLAEKAIENIYEKAMIPIVCGGSGLYIDALLFDYSFMPQTCSEQRQVLNSLSLEELNTIVEENNYDISDIDTQNKRRLIRLIENAGSKPKSKGINKNALVLGLTISQDQLNKNIEKRVGKMFDLGLENEVKGLSNKYGWDIEPMKGIGYREFKDQFNGVQNIEKTKELIKIHSTQLAKKQRTWFKRNNSIQWVSNRDNVVEIIATHLNKYN